MSTDTQIQAHLTALMQHGLTNCAGNGIQTRHKKSVYSNVNKSMHYTAFEIIWSWCCDGMRLVPDLHCFCAQFPSSDALHVVVCKALIRDAVDNYDITRSACINHRTAKEKL